jgi:hypothetical protein
MEIDTPAADATGTSFALTWTVLTGLDGATETLLLPVPVLARFTELLLSGRFWTDLATWAAAMVSSKLLLAICVVVRGGLFGGRVGVVAELASAPRLLERPGLPAEDGAVESRKGERARPNKRFV